MKDSIFPGNTKWHTIAKNHESNGTVIIAINFIENSINRYTSNFLVTTCNGLI